jgi:hypothetical protein
MIDGEPKAIASLCKIIVSAAESKSAIFVAFLALIYAVAPT